MIQNSSFVGIWIMIAGGIILPLAVCIWWLRTKKERLTTVLVGAAIWFIFAMVLETVPKYFLFNPETSLGKTVLGSVVLYTLFGALLAGVFEETGRYIAFKTILRKRKNKETGISYGIGHGGFEAMFLLLYSGIQYVVFASMINSGSFQDMLNQIAGGGVDISTMEALPEQIMAITPLFGLVAVVERVSAMLLHVALSIMVFYSVRESKPWMYVMAVLLHALFDVPAALYQTGVIGMYVTELMLAIYAIVFFVIIYRKLYLKDTKILRAEGDAALVDTNTAALVESSIGDSEDEVQSDVIFEKL